MNQLQESYLKLVNGQLDICRKKHHLGGCISLSPLFDFKIFKKLEGMASCLKILQAVTVLSFINLGLDLSKNGKARVLLLTNFKLTQIQMRIVVANHLQLDDPLESVLQCTCYNKGINYCQLCSQVFHVR